MDSLPTSPSYFVSDNTQSDGTGPTNELSMAQIDGFFSRLPTTEQDRYITELARCRSKDIAASSPLVLFIITGSCFLDKKLKFGSLRVPFYILMGVGTASLSAILYKNSCAQRVRQTLAEEFKKEQNAKIGLTQFNGHQQQQQTSRSEFFRTEGTPPGWGGTPLSDVGRPPTDEPTFSGTPTNNAFGEWRKDQ